MTKTIRKAGYREMAAILFLTFGMIFYYNPADVFAADDSRGSIETGDAIVPIEGPIASEPAEATASDLYLDALTQPAAQEAQNDQALNRLFSETSSDSKSGGSEAQAEGSESEAGTAASVSDQAANPQVNMAKRAAAISQTIGEFSTLSARPAGATGPNTAGSAPGSIHASEQQNFVAAMNVMGNDRQFFSQMMGVVPGQNAPAQMEQMVANMQTGFTQMAEKMATFFAPGQGSPRPGEQGTPGSPMMGPNGAPAGPNNPAGPMMGMGGPMPSGMIPGPNAGLAGPEGMPAGPMLIGMFSMNQMANVMGTAMMAVAMGAPPDQVMGSVENAMQAMHSQAEAYFASNFGTNPNNPEGMMEPNAGPRPEGMGAMPPGMGPYNPAGPMPAGMEGGNFMPGPGGMPFMAGAGFMPGPEGAAFMAPGPGGMSFMPGMPGAGSGPVGDVFQGMPGFSGPGPGGFDPAFTPVTGPPPGVTDNITQQFQQQMVQQIVQSDPRAAAALQALRNANVTVADINNAGGQIVRTNITFVDPVNGDTDHIHGPGAGNGVVFTVGNEGQPHVDANATVMHDHTTDQTSPASPHIPLI